MTTKQILKTIAATALAGVLVGSAFAQAAGPRGQGGAAPGAGPRAGGGQLGQRMGDGSMLVMRADVQRDLKLTDQQKSQVEGLMQRMRSRMESMRGQGQQPGANMSAMAEIQRETSESINRILDEQQRKRLGEIQLQLAGPMALARPDVQNQLNLTQQQRTQLRELQAANMQKNREMMEKVRAGQMDRTQIQAEREKLRKEATESMLKILTPEQATRFRQMQGAPFQADANVLGGNRLRPGGVLPGGNRPGGAGAGRPGGNRPGGGPARP
ncbi:MAG: Spy/CpxP family protein refolding chaperone [Fimbriimonadaceae bacterium]